jgi:hypothetical protein
LIGVVFQKFYNLSGSPFLSTHESQFFRVERAQQSNGALGARANVRLLPAIWDQ